MGNNLETVTWSLAQRLAKAGFKQTSTMRAIAELVASYMGTTKIDWELLHQLQLTNNAVTEIIPTVSTVASNDWSYNNIIPLKPSSDNWTTELKKTA